MWPFRSSASPNDETPAPTAAQKPLLSRDSISQETIPVQQKVSLAQQKQDKLDREEFFGYNDERLGMLLPLRASILAGVSFIAGGTMGAATGSQVAADRYRAENAHRLPTNRNGWFLYHKSKNYHAVLGALREGSKFGCILTGWALVFMATEEVVDRSRARVFARKDNEQAVGQRDVASTVIAAMSVAGVYSWWKGFDTYAAARTSKMALKYSLIYGLVQDALSTARGDRPAYVEWVCRRTLWPSATIEDV